MLILEHYLNMYISLALLNFVNWSAQLIPEEDLISVRLKRKFEEKKNKENVTFSIKLKIGKLKWNERVEMTKNIHL